MRRILVVDDELRTRNVVSLRLTSEGFQVLSADDGRKAIETLEREKNIDLIILDAKMPGMDGYSFLQEIKSKESLRDIPIIILTAYEKLKDMFALEKIADFIPKPYDSEDFIKRVKKVLREAS